MHTILPFQFLLQFYFYFFLQITCRVPPSIFRTIDVPPFQAIEGWMEDMEGFYENSGLDTPKNIDWNFLANMLYVDKIYE
ncbi:MULTISPECIES: DUF7660 family protein [unclassified Lysinibacillus]